MEENDIIKLSLYINEVVFLDEVFLKVKFLKCVLFVDDINLVNIVVGCRFFVS